MNENNNQNGNVNTSTNNVNIINPEAIGASSVNNTSNVNVVTPNNVNTNTSSVTPNTVTPNTVNPNTTTPNNSNNLDNNNSSVNVISGNDFVVHTEALGIDSNNNNTGNGIDTSTNNITGTNTSTNTTSSTTGSSLNTSKNDSNTEILNMPTTDSDIFSINNKKDEEEIVNEKLKHVEVEYKPVSNAKLVLLGFFFIFLLAFIIFLPDISSFVNIYLSGGYNTEEEVITTGKLICSLSSTTSTLDLDYKRVFTYSDSKLEKATFTLVTRGDITLDEATLDDLDDKCKQLVSNVDELTGIVVSCNYLDGELTEKQVFDYSNVNMEQLDSAFTEAGGTLPTFEYQQSIDNIEKTMNAAGYTCKREK